VTTGGEPRPHGRGSAVAAVLFGTLSMATLPLAVAAVRWREEEVIDAAWSIPGAVAFGLVAILLARRSRNRLQRAVATSSRGRTARVGRLLGVTGVLLGITAALAVGVSLVLESVSD
jgi:hypothetical protein